MTTAIGPSSSEPPVHTQPKRSMDGPSANEPAVVVTALPTRAMRVASPSFHATREALTGEAVGLLAVGEGVSETGTDDTVAPDTYTIPASERPTSVSSE